MLSKEKIEKSSKKFLSDCPPKWAFWINNGTVIRNIHELANAIENMNEKTFLYHVNDDNKKNDFALWIRSVLEDKKLANKLTEIRDKELYVKLIKERINEIQDMQFKKNTPSVSNNPPEPFF